MKQKIWHVRATDSNEGTRSSSVLRERTRTNSRYKTSAMSTREERRYIICQFYNISFILGCFFILILCIIYINQSIITIRLEPEQHTIIIEYKETINNSGIILILTRWVTIMAYVTTIYLITQFNCLCYNAKYNAYQHCFMILILTLWLISSAYIYYSLSMWQWL